MVSGFTAFANNKCFTQGITSTKASFPYFYFYSNSDCAGIPTSVLTSSQTCVVPTDDYHTDDNKHHLGFTTVSYVTTLYTAVGDGGSSNSGGSSITMGGIVGIAIGGFAVLVLVVFMIGNYFGICCSAGGDRTAVATAVFANDANINNMDIPYAAVAHREATCLTAQECDRESESSIELVEVRTVAVAV